MWTLGPTRLSLKNTIRLSTRSPSQGACNLHTKPVTALNLEFNILKLAHKSLCDNNSFPEYLKLTLHQVTAYNLRSSTAPVFSTPRESGTFQHSAATLFNWLPIATRNILDHNVFCSSAKKHLFAKYQSWICIIIIYILIFHLKLHSSISFFNWLLYIYNI